jgi:hypothetical protein
MRVTRVGSWVGERKRLERERVGGVEEDGGGGYIYGVAVKIERDTLGGCKGTKAVCLLFILTDCNQSGLLGRMRCLSSHPRLSLIMGCYRCGMLFLFPAFFFLPRFLLPAEAIDSFVDVRCGEWGCAGPGGGCMIMIMRVGLSLLGALTFSHGYAVLDFIFV